MNKVYVVTLERDDGKSKVDAVYTNESVALEDVRDYNSAGRSWTWKEYYEMTLDKPSNEI